MAISADELLTREEAKARLRHYEDQIGALRDDVLIGVSAHNDQGRCAGFTITLIRNPYAPEMGLPEAVRDEVHAFTERTERALCSLTRCVADPEGSAYLAA